MNDRRHTLLAAAGSLLASVAILIVAVLPAEYGFDPLGTGEALGLTEDRVGIKATTNERMGFPGREEGMCALAVASVEMK